MVDDVDLVKDLMFDVFVRRGCVAEYQYSPARNERYGFGSSEELEVGF